LCAEAYRQFPHLERPWLATDFVLSEQWIRALNLLGILAFVCMGLLTAVLVRPRSLSEDVVAGLATGTVCAITAFVTSIAWVSAMALTVSTSTGHDLRMLRHLSANPSAPDVLQAYPDLLLYPPEERGVQLVGKVFGDLVIGVALGLWLGIVFILVACPAFSL